MGLPSGHCDNWKDKMDFGEISLNPMVATYIEY